MIEKMKQQWFNVTTTEFTLEKVWGFSFVIDGERFYTFREAGGWELTDAETGYRMHDEPIEYQGDVVLWAIECKKMRSKPKLAKKIEIEKEKLIKKGIKLPVNPVK